MARYFTLDLVPQLGGQLGLISAEVRYANTSSAVAIFQDQALSKDGWLTSQEWDSKNKDTPVKRVRSTKFEE